MAKKSCLIFMILTAMVTRSFADSGIVPFAVPFYTPETSVGGAASMLYYYDDDNDRVRPDTISFVALYTINNQMLFAMVGNKYFNDDEFLAGIKIAYSSFPKKFYGIGNKSRYSDEEQYDPVNVSMQSWLQNRIFADTYAGIIYSFGRYEIAEYEENGIIDTGEFYGIQPGYASGIGIRVDHDTRENRFNPQDSTYITLSSICYNEYTGSDFHYNHVNLDARYYKNIYRHHVIATQLYIENTDGNPPLQVIPELGGQNVMRGYYQGRYKDSSYMAWQMEYRSPYWGRLGLVVFGGVGEVAKSMKDYCAANIKYSGGAGIRFVVQNNRKIAFRLDVGLSPEDMGVYFNLLHAF